MSARAPVFDGSQEILPAATSAGTQVTAHASDNDAYGSWVEIASAAEAPTSAFRVTKVIADTPSAAGIYKIKLGSGAAASETEIGETKVEVATDAGAVPELDMVGLAGTTLAASTRIAAAITGGSGATMNISIGVTPV